MQYPYPPYNCRQQSTTRPCISVADSFTMAALVAPSSPRSCDSMAQSIRTWPVWTSVAHAANSNLVF
jgi:hypothetical protein